MYPCEIYMKSEATIERENRMEAFKSIDTMKSFKANAIRISAGNTKIHELMKFHICYQLAKEGKDFITECYFLNNKRADIVVPGDLKIIEILSSETEGQCIKKVKMYPENFQMIMVKANQPYDERLIY